MTKLLPPSFFKGTMLYGGAHYTKCPVEIREIWAQGYSLATGPNVLKKLVADVLGDENAEMVVISTCNRFDVCLFGVLDANQLPQLFIQFAHWTLEQIPALQKNPQKQNSLTKNIEEWLRVFTNEKALHHLFRVSASLDSLVLGEPHILGQLKDALQAAKDRGFCRQEAALSFQRAFQAAKKVRTETDLGKNGVSIGHAAVAVALRVFERFERHSCLVIGAGEMAKIAAQHLKACGAERITIANRTLENAQRLSDQIPNTQPITLAEGLTILGDFDVIIAATSCQEFILRKEIHTHQLLRRKLGTPCVLVDISVPRNIDPQLGALQNIFVFDVDDLEKVMDSSRKSREKAAHEAEIIVNEEITAFVSHRKQRDNLIYVGQFHSLVTSVVSKEIFKSIKSNPIMSDEQIQITAEAVAKKLVSHAASLARNDIRLEAHQDSIGDALKCLFNLEHETIRG